VVPAWVKAAMSGLQSVQVHATEHCYTRTCLFNTCSLLGLGMYNTVHMLVTYAGAVWLTTFSWSEPSCRISLAQGFDQSSLDHTSVSDVRPDCSSTRTRPAKRSLTDHMNGRCCNSNPLSVTDIHRSLHSPGPVTIKA
jgi:hypothetical protein